MVWRATVLPPPVVAGALRVAGQRGGLRTPVTVLNWVNCFTEQRKFVAEMSLRVKLSGGKTWLDVLFWSCSICELDMATQYAAAQSGT